MNQSRVTSVGGGLRVRDFPMQDAPFLRALDDELLGLRGPAPD